MDLIGKYSDSKGHAYVLTAIDVFTRFVVLVPIPDKQPQSIATAIFRHIICIFGVPDSMLTDQGREFVNQGLKSMCRTFNIRKITCSPNSNSKGNGHVERFHRFVNSSMYSLQILYGKEWSDYVPAVGFTYNLVANESTGFSPYYLMFGRHPNLPEDTCYGFDTKLEGETQANYHINAGRVMKEAYDYVRRRQQASAERNRTARELDNDQPNYEVGSAVLLFQPGLPAYTIADGTVEIVATSPKKWTPQWTGPHVVSARKGVNNYDIVHGSSGTVYKNQNVNSMFPWKPWSKEISSTSAGHDMVVPWTFGGLPDNNSFVAVGLTDSFEVGKLLVGPKDMEEPLHFHWWSNATNNHANRIFPGWHTPTKKKQGDPKPYYKAERKDLGDRPWTNKETDTTTTSVDIMLNGFQLTKAGKLPAAVKWAAAHSREIFFDNASGENDAQP
jgi:hypothetical protein